MTEGVRTYGSARGRAYEPSSMPKENVSRKTADKSPFNRVGSKRPWGFLRYGLVDILCRRASQFGEGLRSTKGFLIQ